MFTCSFLKNFKYEKMIFLKRVLRGPVAPPSKILLQKMFLIEKSLPLEPSKINSFKNYFLEFFLIIESVKCWMLKEIDEMIDLLFWVIEVNWHLGLVAAYYFFWNKFDNALSPLPWKKLRLFLELCFSDVCFWILDLQKYLVFTNLFYRINL